MESGLKISAVAISAKGSGMNLDNIYVNGRYLAPGSEEPQTCIRKTSHVDFQMYGVCDGENIEEVAIKTSPSVLVMQRMQQLQSVLSMDGAISRDKIWNFLCETNAKIRESQKVYGSEGINSTYAGLFLHKNRGLAVHMGDSRIYVIRGGRMLQITEDHLEATDLYKFGVITQEQAEIRKAESRPTATLGMFDMQDVESQVFSKYFVFYPGDIFILCTDGITDAVSNQEIERIVRAAKDAPKETIAQQLLQLAKDKNEDDKSIIVLEVNEVNGAAAAAPTAPKKEVVQEQAPAQAEVEPEADPEEEAPKKSSFGASLAALAAKVGGSTAGTPEEAQEEGEDDEAEQTEAKPSLFAMLRPKKDEKDEEAAPEAEAEGEDDDEDEEEDDELTILDKIFGNPKLICGILGGIVVIILLIVLLTSLGGNGGKDESGKNESSVTSVVDSKTETSKSETSKTETSKNETSKTEESSKQEESSKTEESSVAGEESSVTEESSVEEESSEEESYVEESSEEETYTPSTPTVGWHTVESGDSFYDILIEYYDTFSEDLFESFCEYNGITTDYVLQPGDMLMIPAQSELE
ncbi:MAG: SpoIIE family protein phosphatase [Firmicutes bacterium]|nr:SpoIIE family protein phosphatase [Bacillota bacterium]